MPYSYQTTIPATSTSGPFYFTGIDGYLSLSHLSVYVNNALVPSTQYTIDTVSKSITFTTPVGAGSVVKIKRTTPKTVIGRVVDFNDASVLTAANLDDAALQNLFISQEAEDTGTSALPPTNDASAWDAGNKRILNVGDPLAATDAATRAYVDTAVLGQGPWTSPQAWVFTGNGTTTYSWTTGGQQTPNSQDVNSFIVEVGGVIQHPVTNYTINTNAIVFAAAVTNGVSIKVRNFGISATLPTWNQTTTFTQPVTFGQTVNVTGSATVDGIDINNSAGNDSTSIYIGNGGTSQQAGGKFTTVVGQDAGRYISTGTDNTFIGHSSAEYVSTGSFNAACGAFALATPVLGSACANNVAIGYGAGSSAENATVTNSIYIGSQAKISGTGTFTRTNEIVIGRNITGDGSNTTRIGNSSTTQTKLEGNLITTGTGTSTIGGALEVNGNITLKAGGTGFLSSGLLPTGCVLQVVAGNSTPGTAIVSSSTTYIDAGLSAAITPRSISSRVLVVVSSPVTVEKSVANTTAIRSNLKLVRGVTDIVTWPEVVRSADGLSWAGSRGNQVTVTYLDSPGTTASTTYKIQIALDSAVANGSTTIPSNLTGQRAVMYLIEIA